MIKLASQLLVTLGAAVLGLYFMGPKFYSIVGVVLAFVVFGILLAVPGKHDPTLDEGLLGYAAKDLGIAALAGLGFGAVWPSLPLIVAWGVAIRRSASSQPYPPTLYSSRRRDEAP